MSDVTARLLAAMNAHDRDGRLAWGRSCMGPVVEGGSDIDEMVQDPYRPPPGERG